MTRRCLAISEFPFLLTALTAGTIPIPTTNVLGTDVFNGPTFVLPTTVQPSNLLNLTAVGQVFLQIGDTYGTNAAGV